MARIARDTRIETRDARSRLSVRHEPYWRTIHSGLAIGYRKGRRGGVWMVRKLQGKKYVKSTLGTADDYADANGAEVLDYKQATKRAHAFGDIEAGEKSLGADPTVADIMQDYLDKHRARGKGYKDMENVIAAHINPAFENQRVSTLTTSAIRRWHESLATTARRNRGKLMPHDPADPEQLRRRKATANRVLTVLKAGLNHAYHEGHAVNIEAWRRVKPFKGVDVPKVRYLSEAEAKRLKNACDPEFRPLVYAALLTGARYGELIRLRVSDYHRQSGTVLIAESKSGKARHVPLTEEGGDLFDVAATGKVGSDYLFARDGGEPWGRAHQTRRIRAACAVAKISPVVSFHELRHTYASMLAMRGVPLQVIATALGHSDTRMTMRHYAHLSGGYVADAIRANALRLDYPETSSVVSMEG